MRLRRLSSRAVSIGLLGTLSLALTACASTVEDDVYVPVAEPPAADSPAYVPPPADPSDSVPLPVEPSAPAEYAVTAYCVADDTFDEGDGSYEIADDALCYDESYAGFYYWYYGGSRAYARISGGSTVAPRHGTVVTSGGQSISRGGFGNRTSGGVSG